MIKSNELRIGNILNGGIVVESIDDIGINTGSRNSCLFVNGNPILLTPEILEKAGFVRNSNHDHTIDLPNDGYISVDTVQDVVLVYDKDGNVFAPYNQPLNLHQLQNLYFALTGEELMIEDLNVLYGIKGLEKNIPDLKKAFDDLDKK